MKRLFDLLMYPADRAFLHFSCIAIRIVDKEYPTAAQIDAERAEGRRRREETARSREIERKAALERERLP